MKRDEMLKGNLLSESGGNGPVTIKALEKRFFAFCFATDANNYVATAFVSFSKKSLLSGENYFNYSEPLVNSHLEAIPPGRVGWVKLGKSII